MSEDEQSEPTCRLIFSCPADSKAVKVYLSQNNGVPQSNLFELFSPKRINYSALCDDFGPMNFASVTSFIKSLDKKISKCIRLKKSVVFCAGTNRRSFTNSVFLLGTYMALRMRMPLCKIASCFETVSANEIEPYRDATFFEPDFGLAIADCWAGLRRAIENSWLAYPSKLSPSIWGKIDIEEYRHYDSPLNGDVHEVVPGKFIAFSGPRKLDGLYHDDSLRATRDFSPAYFLDIFSELGVSTVVRLNEPHYDRSVFTDSGLEHFDLYFEDCTVPSPAIVTEFCRIADSAPGSVAVHCSAGLGRTGTLIAAHMVLRQGFTAREAMGWLRFMRTGSVIGEQQHFLCGLDRPEAVPAPATCAVQRPGRKAPGRLDPLGQRVGNPGSREPAAQATVGAMCHGGTAPATTLPIAQKLNRSWHSTRASLLGAAATKATGDRRETPAVTGIGPQRRASVAMMARTPSGTSTSADSEEWCGGAAAGRRRLDPRSSRLKSVGISDGAAS